MKITGQTELKEKPIKTETIEETSTFISEYGLYVSDQDTGVKKIVISRKKDVTTIFTVGNTHHHGIVSALIDAGNEVEL